MLTKNNLQVINSAYDILALVLKLKKHTSKENIYVDKNNTYYIRNKWGFEKAAKYNQRIALRRKERQFDQLADDYKHLKHDYDLLLQRKTGLSKHLKAINEILKVTRKEKGFFKKHLKEVLDKNTALEKCMERKIRHEKNQAQQIEKLKMTKDNLLEENIILTDKTKQQKSQINALQKFIEELKMRAQQQSYKDI